MFYADFAYYFDWQFIFYLYKIILNCFLVNWGEILEKKEMRNCVR